MTIQRTCRRQLLLYIMAKKQKLFAASVVIKNNLFTHQVTVNNSELFDNVRLNNSENGIQGASFCMDIQIDWFG